MRAQSAIVHVTVRRPNTPPRIVIVEVSGTRASTDTMSMHNAVTIELITSSKDQKKNLIILSSPHIYKTMKQKMMVTSNPVITIYGSGACAMMKKAIDATVTTNRSNFTKHFRVQQKA